MKAPMLNLTKRKLAISTLLLSVTSLFYIAANAEESRLSTNEIVMLTGDYNSTHQQNLDISARGGKDSPDDWD